MKANANYVCSSYICLGNRHYTVIYCPCPQGRGTNSFDAPAPMQAVTTCTCQPNKHMFEQNFTSLVSVSYNTSLSQCQDTQQLCQVESAENLSVMAIVKLFGVIEAPSRLTSEANPILRHSFKHSLATETCTSSCRARPSRCVRSHRRTAGSGT